MEEIKIFEDIPVVEQLTGEDKLLVGMQANGELKQTTVSNLLSMASGGVGEVGAVNYHCYYKGGYSQLSAMQLPPYLSKAGIFGRGTNRIYGQHPYARLTARKITITRYSQALNMKLAVFFMKILEDGYSTEYVNDTYTMAGDAWPTSYPVTFDVPEGIGEFEIHVLQAYDSDVDIDPEHLSLMQFTVTKGENEAEWSPFWLDLVHTLTQQ